MSGETHDDLCACNGYGECDTHCKFCSCWRIVAAREEGRGAIRIAADVTSLPPDELEVGSVALWIIVGRVYAYRRLSDGRWVCAAVAATPWVWSTILEVIGPPTVIIRPGDTVTVDRP